MNPALVAGARRDVAQDGAEPGREDWHQQQRGCSLNQEFATRADERIELDSMMYVVVSSGIITCEISVVELLF